MLKRAGRYEIVAELGHGGFGRVYRAFDPNLQDMVAVKTLSVDSDPAILARFRNEAAASRRLQHRYIVTIHDFGEQDGMPFIVMELLEGQDLQRVIESGKTLPLWHKIQIMTQIASGLGHAHEHGIVHRDVKPANVMLLPSGDIKIMDFGIAKVSRDTRNNVTPQGAVIGTVRYMAPEQFRGLEQDSRADIFAYGLMFYELLSGVHPFHADALAALINNILSVDPVPIQEVCPDCPPQIQEVIARLLQKDAEFRYQNLEDVLFDCEPVLTTLKRARAHELFEEARQAYTQHQLDTAQSLLREVLELDPFYAGSRELREQIQTEQRRAAVRPRVEALKDEARQYLLAGNSSAAKKQAEAAARLDPSDTVAQSLLEQAMVASQQARQLARLAAEVERALRSGDLARAHLLAQQAVELVPTDPRAAEMLAKTQAALAELDRRIRLADGLARVRSLVEIRSWDEASGLLAKLESEFPRLDELRELRQSLESGRQVDERQQKLAAGLASARQEMREHRLEAARDRLVALLGEFPDAAELDQLLRFTNSEIETRARTEFVERSVREAREFIKRNQFADASTFLRSALERYPADPVLERELRSVASSQRQAERSQALEHALNFAAALQAERRFQEALTQLDAFSSKYGGEAAVEELRQILQRDSEASQRAEELRAVVRRAKDLLARGNAEEVTKLLGPIKDDSEATRLLTIAQNQLERQAERAAALERAIAAADAHLRQNQFDEAAQKLAEFTARYGADPKAAPLETAIRKGRQEFQRRDELTQLVQRAEGLLAEGKAFEATQLLESPPSYFKDHPEVTRLFDAAVVQRQAQREAALAAALSSALSLEQQGSFADALSTLENFTNLHGPDHRIEEREKAIRAIQEVARRAAQRKARVDELVHRANGLLAQNDPRATLTLLQQESSLADVSREFRELLQKAEAQLAAQQERETIDAMAAEARSLLSRGDLPAATKIIESGLNRYPAAALLQSILGEIKTADAAKRLAEDRAKSEAARLAAERKAQIDELIRRASGLLAQHDPHAALKLLHDATPLVNESRELRELLQKAEANLATQKDREAIDAMAAEARSLLGRGDLPGAAKIIESGLKRYPAAAPLQSVVNEIKGAEREIKAAEAAKRLAEFRAQAIAQIHSFTSRREYDRALGVLQDALAKNPGDPELARLKTKTDADRQRWAQAQVEEKIQQTLRRAQELLALQPAESVALLQALCTQHPGRPELAEQLVQAREALHRHDERKLIEDAEELCRHNRFAEAAAELNRSNRDTSELRAARSRVESLRVADENQRVSQAIQSARATAARNPVRALSALEALQGEFPQRQEIKQAIEEIRTNVHDAERDQAVAEMEALLAKSKFSKARALHQKTVARLGSDAILAELLSRMEENAGATRSQTPVGETAAQPHPSRRAGLWAALGLAAAAIIGVGVWMVSRPKTPAPVQVRLTIATNPVGASVRVGDRSCVTPTCQFNLSPGTYNITALLEGFQPAQRTVTLEAASGSLPVDITLRPLLPPPPVGIETGFLLIQAGLPDVDVFVDQALAGRTDSRGTERIKLAAKEHSVRVEKSGYDAVPGERKVTIAKNASPALVFRLTPQMAKLELRGAPAGIEVRADDAVLGRTDGSTFSRPVQPGVRVLRFSEGARALPQKFDPGVDVVLNWQTFAAITPSAPPPPTPTPAPQPTPTPAPPVDPAERDWTPLSTSSNSDAIEDYLRKYPNSRHKAEAETRLDDAVWSRVNRNDRPSLQNYLDRFRNGLHAREASTRISDLAWNGVDQNNEQQVREFIRQFPESAHLAQGQSLLDQFEAKKRDAEKVRAAVGQFNAAFQKKDAKLLKQIWPEVTRLYLDAIDTARQGYLTLSLENCSEPAVAADMATLACDQVTTSKGRPNRARFTLTLSRISGQWSIEKLAALGR